MRRSKDENKLLFQTIVQGVVYQDNAGRIISMNPAAERILGRSPGEFVGLTSVDAGKDSVREDGSPFPGGEHPSMVALRTGREVRDVPMGVYNSREKRYRWINISAVPLFRPGEAKPYQVYTSFHDITDEKQAKDALLQAFEQRRLALESAQMGAWDYRYDTGEVFWDERCRNLFGLAEGDQIDYGSAPECIPPDGRETVDRAIERAIAMIADRDTILPADLPEEIQESTNTLFLTEIYIPDEGLDFDTEVSAFERQLILESLKKTNGSRCEAAKLLGLKRTTLVEKLKRLNFTAPAYAAVEG
jgi:PAS domain S-box-containing protein